MVLHHQTPKRPVQAPFHPARRFFKAATDKCYSLAAVNFFLCCVGVTQVTRILMWQRSHEAVSAGEVAEKDAKEVADTVKGIAKDPEGAAERAVRP